MNPAAVPIIKESLIMDNLDKRIGELAATHPLTYYFGASYNLIGVLLENKLSNIYGPGDLLIVKKGITNSEQEKLAYDKVANKIFVTCEVSFGSDRIHIIGDIIEERFSDQL